MSDDNDQNDESDDSGNHVTIPRKNIRDLEAKARDGETAKAQLAALQREVAFRDAGINPNDAKLKYFVKGYDGDTSVDAIKAAAIEAGFLAAQGEGQQQVAPFQGVPQSELAAISQANATTAGIQQPSQSASAAYFAALGNAKSEAEAIAVMQQFGVPMPGIG